MDRWHAGEVITRREVWHGAPWAAMRAIVVRDDPSRLVLHVPTGSPFGFATGNWPTADGSHPWHGRSGWAGHGTLMLHYPEEPFSVFHFWNGPDRVFDGWYLNLQDPYRRTPIGIDTLDHELDITVDPDGQAALKDEDALDETVRHGRFSTAEATRIRQTASELLERLARDGIWWDKTWRDWTPAAEPPAGPLPAAWTERFST